MSTPATIREDVFARLPAGVLGRAEVRKTTRNTKDPTCQRFIQLLINGVSQMNNDVAEDDSHAELYALAHGRTLVVGLGLGCDVMLLEDKPEVTAVDVAEISQDVIDLVLPSVASRKLTVFWADALTWVTVVRYDTIWVDVWLDDPSLVPAEKTAMAARMTPLLARGGQLLWWQHPARTIKPRG